jgi:hypothetical protein
MHCSNREGGKGFEINPNQVPRELRSGWYR